MTLFLYRYGVILGLTLITLVSGWDIVKYGLGGITVYWQFSIGYKGLAIVWLGILLILGHLVASHKVKSWGYMYHKGGK